MDDRERESAIRQLASLAGQNLDLLSLWRKSTDVLAEAVPHYMSPCWFTLDPASLLATSHFQEGVLEVPGEWLAQEYSEPDFNKMAEIARSQSGVATLHDATGGEPGRSPRYLRDMVPNGAYQELLAALRTRPGETWGVVGLYREEGMPLFDDDDKAFMASAAQYLAEGARRALLVGEALDPDGPHAPGVIMLDEDWRVLSRSPQAEDWLCELPGAVKAGDLPPAVYAVAGRAIAAVRAPGDPGEVASARVLGRSGRWITVHGSALAHEGETRRVAVIIEPAHPARIAPLLMSAYQLTEREQDLAQLVLQGFSTAEIAARLVITGNTVQQHLKGIFEKTGVRSRRDFTARVFFAHYEPRLRDNERRAVANKPLRGGPFPVSPNRR